MPQTIVAPINILIEDYDLEPEKKTRKSDRKLAEQLSLRGLISAKAARRHLKEE